MRSIKRRTAGLAAAVVLLSVAAVRSAEPRKQPAQVRADGSGEQKPKALPSVGKLEIQKLADGVYAAVRKFPAGMMFESNTVLIINDDDVVVVDTNVSSVSALEVIAALRKLTSKPVSYVVNTHWHDDHIVGNATWRRGYPGVEFIGHSSTLTDLPTVGAKNRNSLLTDGPGFIAFIRGEMAKNKNISGGPLTDAERESYQIDLALADRYIAELPSTEIVLPTLTVDDHLTLHRGKRRIEIRHLGRGHSGADLVVYLPEERIVAAGDLVVSPIPLVGSTSYPAEFAATMDRLIAMQPAVIVPGHGPVMRDDSYLKVVSRLLHSMADQTAAAVARGESLDQTRKSVNLDEFRKAIAGDAPLENFLFNMYVTSPGIAAAHRQAGE